MTLPFKAYNIKDSDSKMLVDNPKEYKKTSTWHSDKLYFFNFESRINNRYNKSVRRTGT